MLSAESAPIHNWSKLAGQRRFWAPSDDKKTFAKNCADPKKFALLKTYGWDNPKRITYQYNSQGFRSPEFESGSAGLALGCSFTMGIGLPIEKTWPSVLSHMLGTQIWNLGVAGGSMDTVFRLLDFYIKALNPDFVTLLSPPPGRFEYIGLDSDYKVALINNPAHWEKIYVPYIKTWMLSDQNTNLMFNKNLLAIQQICHQSKIPFYYRHLSQTVRDAFARDLVHAGVEYQASIAQNFFHQITKKDNQCN
jgi:hypothetical protein